MLKHPVAVTIFLHHFLEKRHNYQNHFGKMGILTKILSHSIALPSKGQKCTVSKPQTFTFVNFQMEHPVQFYGAKRTEKFTHHSAQDWVSRYLKQV